MTNEDKKSPSKDAKTEKNDPEKEKEEKSSIPLSEQDIALFKRYGKGPYADSIKKAEDDMKEFNQKI
jgi:hypothetical protein